MAFDLITLEDADSRVQLAPERGALVTSFRVGTRELLYLDRASFDDPAKNVRGGIPVLFPSPGKLSEDRFTRAGRSGSLKQHGFARTLDWRVLDRQRSSAELELAANAITRAQFPWEFRATLRFELHACRLQLRFSLHNLDREPLPFALGYHPYFLVHERDKAQARIDTNATRAFDNVSKQVGGFRGFDLSARELDLHLLDHGSDASTLHWPDGSRLCLRASPEFRVWVVWTLAGRDFVCLEPWTARGDALNTGEGLLTLAPDALHESWIELDAQVETEGRSGA